MKYYIFNTKEEADTYNEQATELENYDTTLKWGRVIKHPTLDKWAIAANSKLVLEAQAVDLSDDWKPKEEN